MANNINWGKIYESSYFGNTDNGISWGKIYEGIAGGSSLTQEYLNRVLADGGVVESAECIDDNINASIYIKPSGYKNGKIFAQLPKDGSADIDFLRGSLKTKTNKEGNVVDITEVGEELVTNGDFSDGSNGWNIVDGWNISDERLNVNTDDGSLSITSSNYFVLGKTYKLEMDVNVDVGTIRFESGEGDNFIIGTNDTKIVHYFVARAFALKFRRNSTTTRGWIDNVSVKEIIDETDIPPLDYSNGGCPVFNFEPSSTNLLPYSEDFSQWIKGANTVFIESNDTPKSNGTATRVTMPTGGGTYASIPFTALSGNTYTFSIYAKANGSNVLSIQIMTTSTSGVVESSILNLTNEFQRYSISYTATETRTLYCAVDNNGNSSEVDCIVDCAMLEPLPYATSYIPNFGSASGVTRLADQPQPFGNSDLINSQEGVFYVKINALANTNDYRSIVLSSGSISNRVSIQYWNDGSRIRTRHFANGESLSHYITPSSQDEISEIAIVYSSTVFQVYYNQTLVTTKVPTTSMSEGVLTSVNFDDGTGSNSNRFEGDLHDLRVYKSIEEAKQDLTYIQ